MKIIKTGILEEKTEAHRTVAYSGEGDRHFRGNVTDIFNLPHWVLKRNVSGHDQSTFFSFLLSAAFDTSSHRITDQLKATF